MTFTVLVPHEAGVDLLADPDLTVLPYDPEAGLPGAAADADVFVPPFLSTRDVVALTEEMPKLQLVSLLTAGADAWIGRLRDGVVLTDCRGAHGGATAEWVVAALLSVYRHLPRFTLAQDRGEWDYHVTEELAGKRVLVVGAGDVADHIVARLTPFDVETALVGRRARDGVHGIDEVHDLLPSFDACVVVVPLTEATTKLVDARFLAAMPDGAVLVNGARGPVADTDALTAELLSGRLRAAVDVTDPEPLPAGHPLWEAPGLLLTPHVGGSVPGGPERAYRIVGEQIRAFRAGEKPSNLVEGDY